MDQETELKRLREFSNQESAEKEKIRSQLEQAITEVQNLRIQNAALVARLAKYDTEKDSSNEQ